MPRDVRRWQPTVHMPNVLAALTLPGAQRHCHSGTWAPMTHLSHTARCSCPHLCARPRGLPVTAPCPCICTQVTWSWLVSQWEPFVGILSHVMADMRCSQTGRPMQVVAATTLILQTAGLSLYPRALADEYAHVLQDRLQDCSTHEIGRMRTATRMLAEPPPAWLGETDELGGGRDGKGGVEEDSLSSCICDRLALPNLPSSGV